MQTGIRHLVLTCSGLAVAFGSSLANSSARAGAASEDPDSSQTIIVRVFNYTKLSEKTVAEAGAQAGRIFRRAGIRVLWLSCYPSKKGFERHPACVRAPGPTDISLRILYRTKARPSVFRYTIGFCVVPEPGKFGNLASVYSDRIREMAAGAGVPQAVVLSHAAAHEIGHLLLGTPHHSRKGIMCARWSRGELQLAALSRLHFTPQERQLLRAAVRKRLAPQATTERTIAESDLQFEFQK